MKKMFLIAGLICSQISCTPNTIDTSNNIKKEKGAKLDLIFNLGFLYKL